MRRRPMPPANENVLDRWLRPDDIARALGVDRSSIYELIRAGTLPGKRPFHEQGTIRVREKDYLAWLNGRPDASARSAVAVPDPNPKRKRRHAAPHPEDDEAREYLASIGFRG